MHQPTPQVPPTARERRLFRRTERRYRLNGAATTIALLDHHLGPPSAYRVRTDYYARHSRKGEHRVRVRHYGDDATAWVECKRRSDAVVTKRRSRGQASLSAWQRVGGVEYQREAWERGDLRVTLDRGVTANDGRGLPGLVLEVKGPRVPRWLRRALPPRAKGFSKRRWMLGVAADVAPPPAVAVEA